MDKSDLLHDTELCAALGMFPDSGCCVRHPNIAIISVEDEENLVHTCKVCESEFLSGGLRQRRSFAFTIMQVQRLHNDKLGWKEFKRNWQTGSMISIAQSSETKQSEEDDEMISMPVPATDNGAAPLRFDRYKPSSILRNPNKQQVAWKEYTWQIVLRTTQVQEWAMAEKEKELNLLRLKLQQQTLFGSGTVEVKKAPPLATMPPSPAVTERTSASEINFNATMSPKPGRKDLSPPRLPSRKSSGSDQNNNQLFNKFAANIKSDDELLKDGEFKFQGAPKPPRRQASNDLPIPVSPLMGAGTTTAAAAATRTPATSASPTTKTVPVGGASPIAKNSNRGFGRLSNRANPNNVQASVPPTLPTRQASSEYHRQHFQNQHQKRTSNLSNMSELTSPSLFSVLSSDSYDDSAFLSESTLRDPSTVMSSEGDLSSAFGKGENGKELSPKRNNTKSLDTIVSEEFNLDEGSSSEMKLPPPPQYSDDHDDEESTANGEISFLPPSLEPPPPPPPVREDSIALMTPARPIRSKEIQFDGSQDIQFDVSLTPSAASAKTFRRSSISDMQFGAKDKLLQEASLALATPHSIAGRKLKTSDFKKMLPNVPSGFNERAVTEGDKSPATRYSDTTAVRGKLNDSHRPISADDVLLRKTAPAAAKTPPRNGMKLGDFFDNHNKNGDSDNDEVDEFGDLPVGSGIIRVPARAGSLSPVSCVTMLTTDPMSVVGGPPLEEELEPKKGLQNRGNTRLLPMEESFHSDDEESTQASKPPAAANDSTTSTREVVDQIVNDKYGDSGLYTGSVSADTLVPHGCGGTTSIFISRYFLCFFFH